MPRHYLPARRVLLFWLISVLLAGCVGLRPATPAPNAPMPPPAPGPQAAAAPDQATAADYWPTQGWRTAAAEAQGMDAVKLAAALDAVKQSGLNLHSLLVIRNGTIVSETYFGAYNQETRHELYSCTKSFVATLVGIAIDRGKISGVARPVKEFFPGRTFKNWDTGKQALTLEHLLTMTAGLAWVEGDPAYRELYLSRDWVQFMLDKPMVAPPGSRFNYCSGCSHVLSAIVQGQTGMNTRKFAEQELFGLLGITNLDWSTDSAGIPIGGWGLQLTPRDMAKLGYLYLHRGLWDGRQVVSAAWVQAATTSHTGADGPLGYGYQWWVYPRFGAYTALGRDGQTIFVVPDLDLVVVTTAATSGHDAIFQLIEQYIVPAAQKS